MGSLDFFSPSTLGYPGAAQGIQGQGSPCGLPYAQPEPDGFFNKIFGPKSLAYPMPPCRTVGTVNYKSLDEELARQRQQLLPTQYGMPAMGPLTVTLMPLAGGSAAPIVAAPVPSSPAPAASVLQPTPVPPPIAPAVPAAVALAPAAMIPAAPIPAAAVLQPTPVPSAAPVASSEASSTAPTSAASAAQPSPVTVVVNLPALTAPSAAPAAPAATVAPVLVPVTPLPSEPIPTAPQIAEQIGLGRVVATSGGGSCADKIVTAYSTNPRLRARQPRANEEYLEELLDEKFHIRMLTKDATPVAFVVPDGYNAVDIFLGPIEVNPPHGESEDRDEIVTVGDLSITGASQGGLEPGDQITVLVPWRHASWVELAADHLRLPIYARFYTVVN